MKKRFFYLLEMLYFRKLNRGNILETQVFFFLFVSSIKIHTFPYFFQTLSLGLIASAGIILIFNSLWTKAGKMNKWNLILLINNIRFSVKMLM